MTRKQFKLYAKDLPFIAIIKAKHNTDKVLEQLYAMLKTMDFVGMSDAAKKETTDKIDSFVELMCGIVLPPFPCPVIILYHYTIVIAIDKTAKYTIA